MTPLNLLLANLKYFWKKNLLLALGISVSAAVLTGALIVGDSVKYSLNRIVDQRLGDVSVVMETGDRYITSELAESMAKEMGETVSGVLLLDGVAVAGGGQRRLNQVQVAGIDSAFDQIANQDSYYGNLGGDDVIVSTNLAERLNITIGDEFLLRITRASLIPLNAPFVSDDENSVSVRVTVRDIAGTEQLGKFNLKNSQTSPFNLFISKSRLQDLMEIGRRENLILLGSGDALSVDQVKSSILKNWKLADAGLTIRKSNEEAILEVVSDRVFMEDVISGILDKAGEDAQPVLTYFVNSIGYGDQKTPYSFVSTLPDLWLRKSEIIINTWLARDLNVRQGDTLSLSYFLMGPLRELTVDSSEFIIKSVVSMEGYFADRNLAPDLPGLSDAGNCRDWETGVPIDLESIRDKDELYWTEWKGTPKAFISTSAAVDLWQNRFGKYTAYRYPDGVNSEESLANNILQSLDPEQLGFSFRPILNQAEYAAENGVDFSGLFGGLSFFLLGGAILLTILLFLLNLEDRKEQLHTLVIMGIPLKITRRILVLEGMIVSLFGTLLGLLLAIVYNRLVFSALNGVWSDIVRTDMMSIDIKFSTLLTGFAMTLVVAWFTIYFPLNRFLKRKVMQHAEAKSVPGKVSSGTIFLISGILLALLGTGMILSQLVRGEIVNSTLFFSAGGILLISGISFVYSFLLRLKSRHSSELDLTTLSLRNASRNLTRSMSIVMLLAVGAFLVVSTGSNKKDLFVNADDPATGTGGYLYYAESTAPVLQDMNTASSRYNFGLGDEASFTQLRISSGDDASCLNLNKIENPRILGVNPADLEGRFSFVTSVSTFDPAHPWSNLSEVLPGNLIPAIADETVIKWGLGMKVGDTLIYADAMGVPMNLLLVGGLAPSIFQGNVLISNENFLAHFPSHSGTEVFLVEGSIQDTAVIKKDLEMGMRDYGWAMTFAAERLAEFNSVTNTYLSIFMIMGALGLLLGTIGLAIVLYRSIIERGSEIALLRAVGFNRRQIKKMVIMEYMVLLITGSIIGFIAAIIATLPSILSPNTEVSFITILYILLALLLNGWFWIWLLTVSGLRNRSINSALREE